MDTTLKSVLRKTQPRQEIRRVQLFVLKKYKRQYSDIEEEEKEESEESDHNFDESSEGSDDEKYKVLPSCRVTLFALFKMRQLVDSRQSTAEMLSSEGCSQTSVM